MYRLYCCVNCGQYKKLILAVSFFLMMIFLNTGITTNLKHTIALAENVNTSTTINKTESLSANTTTLSSMEKKLPPPKSITIQSAPQPSPLSDLQKFRLEQQLKDVDTGPELPLSNETILGPNIKSHANVTNFTNTRTNITSSAYNYDDKNNPTRIVPVATPARSAIKLFTNESLTTTDATAVLEPAVANKGNVVFYTGNWFAARSTDGGSTWRYIQPTSVMPDYCCDQDVVYDHNHKIFIWYLQGIEDATTGENRIRIGISHDTANWFFYTIKPADIDSRWTHQMSDYPYLALGNKYLYISMNMFGIEDFVRSVVLRISLDDLASGVAPSFSYYNDPSDATQSLFNFTPVQGATDTMYWAVHVSNNHMRIYQWNESTAVVRTFDREVPAWSFMTRGQGDCPGPDDINWCGRAMSKITGGWVANGLVGFLWNADKGGKSTNNATFPYPYINSAMFKIKDNMKYQGRPYIWSPDFAWLYGFASPDNNGNVAVAAVYGGGIYYPSMAAGILGPLSTTVPNWNMKQLVMGTNGPSAGQSPFEWGDYLRVRAFDTQGHNWISSGWTLQGGGQDINVEPRYFVFGQESNSSGTISTSGSGSSVVNSPVSDHSKAPLVIGTIFTEKKR
jgi:hypothetical protein